MRGQREPQGARGGEPDLFFKNETTDKCGRLMNQGAPVSRGMQMPGGMGPKKSSAHKSKCQESGDLVRLGPHFL